MFNEQEIWQIEVQGQIYEANLEELIQWVNEGSVLAQDKVRRGNLRWIEAGKVPFLYEFFNASQLGFGFEQISPTISGGVIEEDIRKIPGIQNFFKNETKPPEPETSTLSESPDEINDLEKQEEPALINLNVCSIHPEIEPRYVCKTCLTLYCKNCPTSYGGEVKICPGCGSMCKIYEGDIKTLKSVGSMNKPYIRTQVENELAEKESAPANFCLRDLLSSFCYPFKFKISLLFGAVLFTLFWLGLSVWTFGGFMLVSAIFCAMLANTFTFGILANTVENFSQNKITLDFMPRFDDFSVWDDVIQPFFLSVGVYLVSYGFFFALLAGAAWNTVNSINQVDEGTNKLVSKVLPVPPNDLTLQLQSAKVRELTEKTEKVSDSANDSNVAAENTINELQKNDEVRQTSLETLKKQINLTKNNKINALINEELQKNNSSLLVDVTDNVLRLSLFLSVPVFLAFLWGVFYFPAACAVAAHTRSFTATLNPLVCFDTIKWLGFDYVKILALSLFLGVVAIVANSVLVSVFAPFDLPMIGNLPVKLFDGLLYFYLFVVFSVVLGFVFYRNSKSLNLPQS